MFAIFIFLIAPVLGLPLYFLLYFFCSDKKKSILYSVLIGIALGIISYYFIPKAGYDLVRHQNVLYKLSNLNFKRFLKFTKNYDLEFIPLLYSYIISFTKNPDLLQFFVVSLGYSIILYILNDYKIETKMNKYIFIFISTFTIISFQHLYFISGLYFYIATIIFSLAVYLDYIKKANKKLCIFLYIITLFIHNAMFLPFTLIIIFKLFKNKFNIRTLITILLIFFSSFLLINYFNQIVNNSITNSLIKMYGNYIENEAHFKIYYSGMLFWLEIFKLAMILISIIFLNNIKNINGFIITLSTLTLLMMTRSSVAIRYILLIQIIGSIPLIDLFNNKQKGKRLIMLVLLIIMTLVYIAFYYNIFKNQNFGNLSDNFYKNVFTIFKRG